MDFAPILCGGLPERCKATCSQSEFGDRCQSDGNAVKCWLAMWLLTLFTSQRRASQGPNPGPFGHGVETRRRRRSWSFRFGTELLRWIDSRSVLPLLGTEHRRSGTASRRPEAVPPPTAGCGGTRDEGPARKLGSSILRTEDVPQIGSSFGSVGRRLSADGERAPESFLSRSIRERALSDCIRIGASVFGAPRPPTPAAAPEATAPPFATAVSEGACAKRRAAQPAREVEPADGVYVGEDGRRWM